MFLIHFYKVRDESSLYPVVIDNRPQILLIELKSYLTYLVQLSYKGFTISEQKIFCLFQYLSGLLFSGCVLCSGSAANSRSSTQMNSYSDSGYQEVSGYYSNTVTPRRSEGRSQSTSSAPSGSPTFAMSSRAEGQASAQV